MGAVYNFYTQLFHRRLYKIHLSVTEYLASQMSQPLKDKEPTSSLYVCDAAVALEIKIKLKNWKKVLNLTKIYILVKARAIHVICSRYYL